MTLNCLGFVPAHLAGWNSQSYCDLVFPTYKLRCGASFSPADVLSLGWALLFVRQERAKQHVWLIFSRFPKKEILSRTVQDWNLCFTFLISLWVTLKLCREINSRSNEFAWRFQVEWMLLGTRSQELALWLLENEVTFSQLFVDCQLHPEHHLHFWRQCTKQLCNFDFIYLSFQTK